MLYKVKTISEDSMKKKVTKSETVLKDLLAVIPTLKKHNLEGEVISKVRKLRSGRKSRSYTVEVSRIFNGKEIKVSSAVTKADDKVKILKKLKDEICQQIKDSRAAQQPPIEKFTFREGVVVDKLAEVYMEPGAFLKVMFKKIRLNMGKEKRPTTKDNYIGVEIELASKLGREEICNKLFEAGVGKFVTIKGDASIGSGTDLREQYPHAHEICVIVKQSEYEEVVSKICKVLNEECAVKVDKTCGLHVHLDMRARDHKTAFHNLVSSQQFLYAMLPAARRNSKYSYPVKGSEFRELDARYYGINTQAYSKFKTLEVRMHCGTTQAKKINTWIELLVSIVQAPKFAFVPTKLEDLVALANLNAEVTSYAAARIAKFASQHKGAKWTAEQPGTMPEIQQPTHAPVDDTINEHSEVA